MAKILVADDEANLRKVLAALLRQDGHDVQTVSNGIEAKAALATHQVDLLLTDLRMPELDGIALLQQVRAERPEIPVIVITAHGTVDTAVQALKLGAADYITKPFDKDELKVAVRKGLALGSTAHMALSPTDSSEGRFGIIGKSGPMRELFTVIEKVAGTPSTVLITGESGTGKELVASALHQLSPRHDKAFVKVNCGAIPADLMESEFFGHEKGAFTGAVGAKPGRFELADEGTLFLDEIGEIPLEMQVKLLRALQESEFERVGGVTTQRVDARVVAATNRNLELETSEGRFREDLLYRLNVVPIHIPPLRDRRKDIPLLARRFIAKYNEKLGRAIDGISPEALDRLSAFHWPGNIRQLENFLERAVLFAEGSRVELRDLPKDLVEAPAALPVVGGATPPQLEALASGDASMKEIVKQAASAVERDLIAQALGETGGNVTRAAALLKISRKGLQNKMKELDLRGEDREED